MSFAFNTPAVSFGGPSTPIGQTNRGDRPFDPDNLLGFHPVMNWPTPVVKNVMFYIDRRLANNNELDQHPLGSPCKFMTGSLVTPAMREAVLTHVEPIPQYAKDNVYRFFYVVPPTLQHLYNIQDMKKNTDGYTLMETAKTGNFVGGDSLTQGREFKQFYEIQRIFVYQRDRGYTPAQIGSFDPSNTDTTPNYNEDHPFDGYDAQLVGEEVVPFEEDYMNKVFVRVVRTYKTLPGPVVKELISYASYINGQTVWITGGPDSEVQGIAETGQRWSREVWGFPEPSSTKEPTAKIPRMPDEATTADKINTGWDKGSFPCLQTYVITKMYKSNSNLPLNETTDSLAGNCCNPPPAFVRCINTSTTKSENIDWSGNGTLPPLVPPDPSENCSQWRVDASVVVREGYSQKETRKTCTTYDMVDHYFETEIDSKTGEEIVVQYTRVDNPALDPADPDWEEVTDPNTGVKLWKRKGSDSKTEVLNGAVVTNSTEDYGSASSNKLFVFTWGTGTFSKAQSNNPKYIEAYPKYTSQIKGLTVYANDMEINRGTKTQVRLVIFDSNGAKKGEIFSNPTNWDLGSIIYYAFPNSALTPVVPGDQVCVSITTSGIVPVSYPRVGVQDITGTTTKEGWINDRTAKATPDEPSPAYVPHYEFNVDITIVTPSILPKGYLMYRKWVNPCHAVDIMRPVQGVGWYKKYTTVQNYSFPPILDSFGWQAWNTRPDLSGRSGGRYFPQVFMNRDGYSGPCTAIVEEIFSPDATLPAGWGLGVDVQYVTASASISTPLVSFNLPACLHSAFAISVSIGSNDGVWQSGVATYNFPATTHTTWKAVTMVHVTPFQKGAYIRKTTIQPPA